MTRHAWTLWGVILSGAVFFAVGAAFAAEDADAAPNLPTIDADDFATLRAKIAQKAPAPAAVDDDAFDVDEFFRSAPGIPAEGDAPAALTDAPPPSGGDHARPPAARATVPAVNAPPAALAPGLEPQPDGMPRLKTPQEMTTPELVARGKLLLEVIEKINALTGETREQQLAMIPGMVKEAEAVRDELFARAAAMPDDDEEDAAPAVDYTKLTVDELRRRAGDADDPLAQNELGVRLYFGDGVEEDKKAAMVWYRRAANAGVAEAQHNLGAMFANGETVPRDPNQAEQWFCRAADQDYQLSKDALKTLRANQ